MEHYIIARKVPNEDIGTLDGEAYNLRMILHTQDVFVGNLVPSGDHSRFEGFEQTMSWNKIHDIQRNLRAFGYNLEGPFDDWKTAHKFWQTGKANSN